MDCVSVNWARVFSVDLHAYASACLYVCGYVCVKYVFVHACERVFFTLLCLRVNCPCIRVSLYVDV